MEFFFIQLAQKFRIIELQNHASSKCHKTFSLSSIFFCITQKCYVQFLKKSLKKLDHIRMFLHEQCSTYKLIIDVL